MPIIIYSTNTTILDTVTLTGDVQIAPGVTLNIAAGGTLNLAGYTLTNFGSVVLQGTENAFAKVTGGVYSTDSTTGVLTSNYGSFESVKIASFFSEGRISATQSIFLNSKVEALDSTSIEDSLFIDSVMDLGIETAATITRSTFKDSLLTLKAWANFGGGSASVTESNFISKGLALELDPFFPGSHSITLSGNYMYVPPGSSFEDKVYDRDDNLRISTDISPASFTSIPKTNSADGFKVGSYLIPWIELGFPIIRSLSVTGSTGGDVLFGGPANDLIQGLAGNDQLFGGNGNDALNGGTGNDIIDGGNGIDSAVFSGTRANYIINITNKDTSVNHLTGVDGIDTLTSVERLQFSDVSLALDLSGNAGSVAKILGAVFGPTSLNNTAYTGIGLNLLDEGMDYLSLMDLAISVAFGFGASREHIVQGLYSNVVGSSPDATELSYFAGLPLSNAELGALAAETFLNEVNIDLVGLNVTGLLFTP